LDGLPQTARKRKQKIKLGGNFASLRLGVKVFALRGLTICITPFAFFQPISLSPLKKNPCGQSEKYYFIRDCEK
jgi:hypothetical protein